MQQQEIPHLKLGYCHEPCAKRTRCACGRVVDLPRQTAVCECGREHIKGPGSAFVKDRGPLLLKRPGGQAGCPGFGGAIRVVTGESLAIRRSCKDR